MRMTSPQKKVLFKTYQTLTRVELFFWWTIFWPQLRAKISLWSDLKRNSFSADLFPRRHSVDSAASPRSCREYNDKWKPTFDQKQCLQSIASATIAAASHLRIPIHKRYVLLKSFYSMFCQALKFSIHISIRWLIVLGNIPKGIWKVKVLSKAIRVWASTTSLSRY